ncbi:MAG: nucleotide exchange factor GrpE [Bacteroidales bacterium]|nr:nucleotide exchange factor GrpE [Bacteroidales bacterium]
MSKNNETKDAEKQTVENIEPVVENPAVEIEEESKVPSSKKKKSAFKGKADKMAEENEGLRLKLAEVQDKYLRLFSEFDNYRKRTAKEKIDIISSASANLMEQLLPIMDDIDRANKAFEDVKDLASVKNGCELIFTKFQKTLASNGLKEIESTGMDFDPEHFDAVANYQAPSDDMKNKVIDTTEKGYSLNGKVIRHPKVVVGC